MKRIIHWHLVSCLLLFIVVFLFLFSCRQNKPSGSTHQYTNALINETSPYLLQHAHNPVNWRPWSPKALKDATADGKLVIISIGYSSCHWCHVMEEETFENEEVAALMNEQFISIKVDREERPDVDQVYMTAAQLLTGSGGWPLNVITLPDGKPIYAGTYHSREEWIRVLQEISTLFRESPEKAREYADKVAQGVKAANLVQPANEGGRIREDILLNGLELWKGYWDMEWGGNLGQQKFMIPSNLDFLLDYSRITGDTLALRFVKTTLDRMAMGGVYDQIGGGFFRYSTDPRWHVPHFEKMLYDNAQLLSLYSRAYSLFKNPEYKELAYQIVDFLQREMKHPEGAYFAAIDADSDGGEGAYYLWNKELLKDLLKGDFPLFAAYYNIEDRKVLEDGDYVLHKSATDHAFMQEYGLVPEEFLAKKEQWHYILLAQRESRPPPGIDDKVITSWNALLISGFIHAYSAFGEEAFLKHALDINDYLIKYSRDGDKLVHSYKTGSRRIEGFLEDYANLAEAQLDLYLATGNETYFQTAKGLMETANSLFYEEDSGFYRFKEDDELIAKIIKTNDGVQPSPNSVMAHNLLRLGHIVYDRESMDRAEHMLRGMAAAIEGSPDAHSRWAKLLLQLVRPFYEVAIAGPEATDLHAEMMKEYLPNTLIVASDTDSEMPLFKNRYVEGTTYIYVCQDHSCRLPETSVGEAIKQIRY